MKKLIPLLFLANSVSLQAQTCLGNGLPTTPEDNFVIAAQGEVRHVSTNLIWRRCAQGQTWNDNTSACEGEAERYMWQEALVLAQNANDNDPKGWRLPNLKELASVTERLCVRPAINSEIFPGTPPDDFWTSTPSMERPTQAWVVAFFNSSHSAKEKQRYNYVRLVRTQTQ